jgi:hypothetical protein
VGVPTAIRAGNPDSAQPIVDRTPAGPTLSLAPRISTENPRPERLTFNRTHGMSRRDRCGDAVGAALVLVLHRHLFTMKRIRSRIALAPGRACVFCGSSRRR